MEKLEAAGGLNKHEFCTSPFRLARQMPMLWLQQHVNMGPQLQSDCSAPNIF